MVHRGPLCGVPFLPLTTPTTTLLFFLNSDRDLVSWKSPDTTSAGNPQVVLLYKLDGRYFDLDPIYRRNF